MRLYLLLLGIAAGLWFTAAPDPSAAATATPRPTPTIKACHICDEEIMPAATPTVAEAAQKGDAVVHAVMFWMATCPHCHVVLNEVLPPLQQKYGDQLQIHLIEVKSEEIWNHMVQVGTALGFSPDRLGVPFLVIGDKALIGSGQIPAELPGLIEQHLAAGGLDYPDIPALAPLLPAAISVAEEVAPQPTAPATVDSGPTGAEKPVVRAVMFWMSGCPDCHDVLDETLPPLQQQYHDRLEILLIETSSPEMSELAYQAAQTLAMPQNWVVVPFLVIGDTALFGSRQIADELPGLIEKHLAAGGLDYPDIPGLADLHLAVAADEQVEIQAPASPDPEEPVQSLPAPIPVQAVQLLTDLPSVSTATEPAIPNGFGLAIAIMVGMVVALAYTGAVTLQSLNNPPARPATAWSDGAIPVLAIIGLGVAVYLAYVETQAVAAVCGPVGDCNAVQSSPYAKLFGVLPVGVLGAIGYIAILVAWLWGRFGSGRLADYAPLAMFGMALFGVLFSLYLTYLEPFVIGAVCIWCLTSAVIITLLMLLSLKPAMLAIQAERRSKG